MPVPIKPNTENGSFFPKWDCFACHDSGIIPDYLARMVQGYENYNCHDFKNLRCTCSSASRFAGISEAFDNSLTESQRMAIHRYSHSDWLETAKADAKNDPKLTEMREKVTNFIYESNTFRSGISGN